MINVIYLVSRLKQSGPINQAYNIVTGMSKRGCKMIVVTLSPELPQTRMQMFKDAGIEVIQLNRKNWDIYGCVKDLKAIIKKRQIGIVHSSGDRPDLCNFFLRNTVVTVSTLRSEVENIAERKGWFVNIIAKTIYKKCIRTVQYPIACSHFLAMSIERSTGRKIQVIHNCVNNEYFKPAENKQASKASLGIDEGKIVYLSLGSIIKRKNNDILLDYFSANQSSNELLIVAGVGEMLEYYKRKYTSKNIRFVGNVNALPYLQSADYLISASLSEGLPNTVLESISCGIPVILSEIGPHKEILQEGDVGVLFDCDSISSLDSAIKKIRRANYDALSAYCRKIADVKFSKNTTSRKYFELYSSSTNKTN